MSFKYSVLDAINRVDNDCEVIDDRQQLINKVLKQIVIDVVEREDLTAIEELLTNVNKDYLLNYLPQENL